MSTVSVGLYFSHKIIYILEKPNVTFSCSNPYTINEGDNSTCVCRGEDGNPPANVTWYDKNGVQIGVTGKEGQTLPLSNVSATDRGNYTCRAQSHTLADNKSIEVKIRLNFKPSNTNIMFTPKRAVVGESVTITCISEGFPEPSYSIIHNATEVSTNKTYTIDDMQHRHAGIYTCVAMNKLGNDSASGNLTVIVKPYNTKITITPEKTEVGTSVNITCYSEGRPEPRYSITHNRIVLNTGKTCTISKVKLSDAGTYECIAWNKLGNDSASAYLTVEVKPYNTKITITPEEVKVGTSVNITCYSEGRPEPRYNITYNRIVLSTGKTYTISKANLSDAGTYECIAWNKLGNDSASANLTVQVKPENTKITITQEGVLDSPVTITCSSKGRPEPNYTITHNGTMPSAGRMYIIPKVKWSDAGTYKCIAENKLGRDSAFAYLTFKGNTYDNTDNGTTVVVWHIVVTLVSGFILGILFSYIASCSRRRWFNNRKPERNSEPKTTEVDTTYQELDLSKMNTEDNYQSLSVNAASNDVANDDDSTYTQLSKTRDVEDNYQSLT
ncbi:B-cell receptor CD22-like [Paramuricea clavata]|uniref:B-cell receptor CD22-like n=1 Tax=Paramuricea clavata TaxID=317549 RepID=A0A6S7J2M6_PARCT|nr:B-cell receptor CD22-like [Paramuricea clavata]